MVRSLSVLPLVLTLFATTAPGQDNSGRRPVVDFRVQVGYLPLNGGDASVGSVSAWLPSVGVGYWLPFGDRRTMLEVAVAHAGQDDDAYNRAPAFTFLGVLLHGALRAPTAKGLQPMLVLGMGRLRVDAAEIVCEIPCFEGGSSFVDASFTTLIGGAGILLPVTSRTAIRGDIRLFLPLNDGTTAGDSDDLRPEVAAGIVFRL